MKISGCKSCGTRFNGLRCPTCGRPIPAMGCLTIFLPTVVVLAVLAAVIPAEPVPRVRELSGGSTEYCFQSLQVVILLPAGVALFVTFAIIYAIVFKTRKMPTENPPSPSRWWKYVRWIGRRIICVVVTGLLLMLALVLASVLVIDPSTRFHKVVVGRDRVELHALWRSWSLPRSRIVRVEFLREEVVRGQQRRTDMSFLIEDDAGEVHESVVVGYPPGDPLSKAYANAFEKLRVQLGERR
jgi:hypothetical protein